MNLKDASLDVQLTLTPRGDETKVQQDDTLAEKGSGGGAEADQLIYRPDSRPEVSDYDYALTIDGELEHDITGPKIVGSVTREFDSDACLVLHYIVNEPDVTVAYSHELYPACDLPE